MENLIQLLQDLENDTTMMEDHNRYLTREDHKSIENIKTIAYDYLITEEGECNWDNIQIMKEYKFYAFPVEKDRCGWLIGGISTRKGIITYG